MRGIKRMQLVLIAIIALLIDNIAYLYVESTSLAGIILHIVGKIAIPIMCYLLVYDYRNTTNIKRYIDKLVSFWLMSMIPFYMYFRDIYGYRQNLMFDLLLAFLVLVVIDNKKLNKLLKSLLVTVLLAASIFAGSCPIIPIIFTLIFYYHGKFNGLADKNKNAKVSSWFYIVYPIHFLVLFTLKQYGHVGFTYSLYVILHITATIMCLFIIVRLLRTEPSKIQLGTILFAASAIVYSVAFCCEITCFDLEGIYTAIKVEYIGECLIIIAYTWLIKELCHINMPKWVYTLECIMSFLFMSSVYTTRQNRVFYTEMKIDNSGTFPRIDLTYGTAFYLFMVYILILYGVAIYVGYKEYKISYGVDKKRIKCMIIAPCFAWLPAIIKDMGLTNGYEVPAVGIIGAVIFIGFSIIRYGCFDSMTLAREIALRDGCEGIVVVNPFYKILYSNDKAKSLIGKIANYGNALDNPMLRSIFMGDIKALEINDRIYDMRIDNLMEAGYNQGYMLWIMDMTEHYNELRAMNEIAKNDGLTGVLTKRFYEINVKDALAKSSNGSLMMLDLDNFKNVNDSYGHKTGDLILEILGKTIRDCVADMECITGRVGGDEFSIFFNCDMEENSLIQIANKIIDEFRNGINATEFGTITSVSIGIAYATEDDTFDKLYSNADKALYMSKHSGKNTYKFYQA